MTAKTLDVIRATQAFFNRYMVFPSQDFALAAALYSIATHFFPHFDSFPYCHITAATKRAGKSRLAELMTFIVRNPKNFSAATPATIFQTIANDAPTIFVEEVEKMASEAHPMRPILNVGYRRGQTIPRMVKGVVVEFPSYCPKVFIGIGDVYDTLRDRCIVISLVRGQPAERFLFEVARVDGEAIRDRLLAALDVLTPAVVEAYTTLQLPFLGDRDEELWLPLFAVCSVIAPDLVPELERVAVDIATAKTETKRTLATLAGSEDAAMYDEYSTQALRDLVVLVRERRYILSADAVEAMKAIPTSPWRKFRGGLTVKDLSLLVRPLGLNPKNIRVNTAVRKGYKREDVERVAKDQRIS